MPVLGLATDPASVALVAFNCKQVAATFCNLIGAKGRDLDEI